MKSLPAKMWQHARPLNTALSKLVKQAGSRHSREMIPTVGVLLGALAFGLWWQSFAAAVFATIVLLFLAGIYRSNRRLLAALRQSESKAAVEVEEEVESVAIPEPAPENSAAVNEAVQYLQPWLANEVALTEESVRDRCSVLVDSVLEKARQMTSVS